MAFLDSYYEKKVNAAVKQYYLSLGRSEIDWESKILSSSRSYNLVWRSALRRIYPHLELNDRPPPFSMRRIFNFSSGRDSIALTVNQ